MGYGTSYMKALLSAFLLGHGPVGIGAASGAARGQKQRRKIARQTTRRNRGVRCQGRPSGSGRTHR